MRTRLRYCNYGVTTPFLVGRHSPKSEKRNQQIDDAIARSGTARTCPLFNEEKVSYALCGGMAVGIHGYPRFTQDIDFLIPPESLDQARGCRQGWIPR